MYNINPVQEMKEGTYYFIQLKEDHKNQLGWFLTSGFGHQVVAVK